MQHLQSVSPLFLEICAETWKSLITSNMVEITSSLSMLSVSEPGSCLSWKAFNKSIDLLLENLQILRGNDKTPASCAATVVNEDLSVYLQFKGAVNVDAEREKLRKKRDEILE